MSITINNTIIIDQPSQFLKRTQMEILNFKHIPDVPSDTVQWKILKAPISNNDANYVENWGISHSSNSVNTNEILVLNLSGTYKIEIEETINGVNRKYVLAIQCESLKESISTPFPGETIEVNDVDGWARKVEDSIQSLAQNEGCFSVIGSNNSQSYVVGDLVVVDSINNKIVSGFIYGLNSLNDAYSVVGYNSTIGIVVDVIDDSGDVVYSAGRPFYRVLMEGAYKLNSSIPPFNSTSCSIFYDTVNHELSSDYTKGYYVGKYFYNSGDGAFIIIENQILMDYENEVSPFGFFYNTKNFEVASWISDSGIIKIDFIHNLNSSNIIVEIWNESNSADIFRVNPLKVLKIDNNNISIHMNPGQEFDGRINIIRIDSDTAVPVSNIIDVQLDGISSSQKDSLNFITGDNVSLVITDNNINGRADITINAEQPLRLEANHDISHSMQGSITFTSYALGTFDNPFYVNGEYIYTASRDINGGTHLIINNMTIDPPYIGFINQLNSHNNTYDFDYFIGSTIHNIYAKDGYVFVTSDTSNSDTTPIIRVYDELSNKHIMNIQIFNLGDFVKDMFLYDDSLFILKTNGTESLIRNYNLTTQNYTDIVTSISNNAFGLKCDDGIMYLGYDDSIANDRYIVEEYDMLSSGLVNTYNLPIPSGYIIYNYPDFDVYNGNIYIGYSEVSSDDFIISVFNILSSNVVILNTNVSCKTYTGLFQVIDDTTIQLLNDENKVDEWTYDLTTPTMTINIERPLKFIESIHLSMLEYNQVLSLIANGELFMTDSNTIFTSTSHVEKSFIVGSYQMDNVANPSCYNRMFYDKTNGSFRVGRAISTQWDDRGDYSFVAGRNCLSSGDFNFVGGDESSVHSSSNYNSVWGERCDVTDSSYNSIVGTTHNVDTSAFNIIIGGSIHLEDSNYSNITGFNINLQCSAYNNITGISNNIIGLDGFNLARYNNVIGHGNIVNTSSYNIINGEDNNVDDSDYNIVSGDGHDVVGSIGNSISGSNHNTDDTHRNGISGNGHNIDGSNNNSISGDGHIINNSIDNSISGKDNNVNGSNYNIISGVSHIINNSTDNSIIGYSHTIDDSSHNSISGYGHDIDDSYNNSISGDTHDIDDSSHNSISGYGHDIDDSSHNSISGYGNDIDDSDSNSISGDIHSINNSSNNSISGYGHDIDNSDYNIISGFNNKCNDFNSSLIVGSYGLITSNNSITLSNQLETITGEYGLSQNVNIVMSKITNNMTEQPMEINGLDYIYIPDNVAFIVEIYAVGQTTTPGSSILPVSTHMIASGYTAPINNSDGGSNGLVATSISGTTSEFDVRMTAMHQLQIFVSAPHNMETYRWSANVNITMIGGVNAHISS